MDRYTSKYISLLLRHDPGAAGLKMDDEGWVDLDALVEGLNRNGHRISREQLVSDVRNDAKSRFMLSNDGMRIRACHGHSVPVHLNLKASQPPEVLWHGTAEQFMDSIQKQGLLPQSRLQVHLHPDPVHASQVGRRHGKLVLLKIDAAGMARDGYLFYESGDNVWLTDIVPPKYMAIESGSLH